MGPASKLYPIMILDTKTAAEAAADQIRALLFSGRFRLGEPLRQDRLAQELGISRTPLRQALQVLSEEGLVRVTGFKGARVAEISATMIEDLFQMRFALEPLALRSALPVISKLDLAKAEMVLEAASPETEPARLSELNWAFHNTLYAPSGRALLLETVQRLNRTSTLAEVIARSIAVRAAASHSEHLELLKACRAGDADRAVDTLIRHLENAFVEVHRALED